MGRKQGFILALLALVAASCSHALQQKSTARYSTFHYDHQCLSIDGHDMVIFSGAFHYFRCPKELWAARFEKIRAAGFNTVETYIPWNLCETQMPAGLGDYSKINLRDVEDWLNMAERYGFYIIIRPGPYICAEWDHGGFPGWLITKRPANYPAEKTWLRSDDPTYIAWCRHWFNAVCPMLARHQITRKAPGQRGIILFQLENEYDYSGMSEEVKMSCVKSLAECALAHGIDVPLFTCWTHSIRGNSDPVLSKVFDSCNFYPGWGVDGIAHSIRELRAAQPNAPLMTTELQGGWFTGVGEEPPLRPDVDQYRPDLVPAQIQNLTLFAWQNGDTITNYYMLFGGTNFADHAAQGIATSYDYSAPIRENGGVGEKYRVVQGLGAMIRAHGTSMARTKMVAIKSQTGFDDVSVAERQGDDGSRYIFVRADQHGAGRSGTARLTESDGAEISFAYQLGAFGSKVLYLPPGVTDASEGEWLPKEQPPIQRPKLSDPVLHKGPGSATWKFARDRNELPVPVEVTDIRTVLAPAPTQWKAMSAGQHLPDLGIYDSRFVYYAATIHLSPEDLSAPASSGIPPSIFSDIPSPGTPGEGTGGDSASLALKIDHASGDHVLAVLNGHPIQPVPETGEVYFSPQDYLHAGDNHLLLLYENTGFANIGGALEKLAGVSNISVTPLPNDQHAIGHWQMHSIRPSDDPQSAAKLASNNDIRWYPVAANQLNANQLRPHGWAVFRATVDLSDDQLASAWTHLHFARIDDEGWIFVNGQQIGRGLRWDQPVECDALPALHTGSNSIVVVIHNNDGDGGLGPVTWSPQQEQTVGAVSSLCYCDQLDEKPRTKSMGDARDSLLTCSSLTFDLPKSNRHVWVPWLVRLHAAGNGFMYLNGHSLGRYWQDGHQNDYFLADCWLKFGGKNELTFRLRSLGDPAGVHSATLLPYSFYAENR